MGGLRSKWRLTDVVDFEVLLSRSEEAAEARRHREEVGRALAGVRTRNERKRRRLGLMAWMDSQRLEQEAPVGEKVMGALRGTAILFGVLAFFAGLGLARGLLVPTDMHGEPDRGYNIWLFLAVAVGVQWLVLVGGALLYVVMRRDRGTLSVLQRVLGGLARRAAGTIDGAVWKRLTAGGRSYGGALSWRLGRMAQGAAVGFNFGLLAGFFGILWLFDVWFYWESTLMSQAGMEQLFAALASPWSWSGEALPAAWKFSVVGENVYIEDPDGPPSWPYLAMCLLVWGLLPRLVLWVACVWGERRALARLAFQEPRHRELWRQLTRVQRSVPTEGPADGVVLLDVGGIGVETGAVREFLLRAMRVNPEGRYEAATLDAEAEAEAWKAIRKAPLGVVFLVEGWALSPKQMSAIYERVRAVGKQRILRFLVLGEVADGVPTPPDAEDFAQWRSYVDGLRDPWTEVVAYETPQPVGGQG